MKYREPETRGQQFIDAIFNGTGAITTCVQDLNEIASALMDLGIPAGEKAAHLLAEIRGHAQTIASAMGNYVGSQANGTLYDKPEKAA